MYTIYLRCYPQADIDFCYEMDLPAFKTLEDAKKTACKLENHYKDDGWIGHWLHNAKFYADTSYLRFDDYVEIGGEYYV